MPSFTASYRYVDARHNPIGLTLAQVIARDARTDDWQILQFPYEENGEEYVRSPLNVAQTSCFGKAAKRLMGTSAYRCMTEHPNNTELVRYFIDEQSGVLYRIVMITR